MYNVAIIGAGQLGSRHLQGLKGAASPLSITVVDSSEASLKVAEEHYESVSAVGEKSVQFTTTMNQLSKELDLVIVSTSSRPRADIVKSLLRLSKVKYLILEKVLFPKLCEYDEIDQLLKEYGVTCWVNCPRRMYGIYSYLSHKIDKSKPVKMINANENWGLCCNSIHNIDLFMYLTGESTYTIDVSGLHREILNSKREGYIEMTGTLIVTTPNGSRLTLTSENGYKGPKGRFIENNGLRIFLDESKAIGNCGDDHFSFIVPFQSQLSGLLADEILKTGGCQLTPYAISASYHKPFLSALLSFYNEVNGTNSEFLAIT